VKDHAKMRPPEELRGTRRWAIDLATDREVTR